MVEVSIGLDDTGLLSRCDATGHAGFGERGTDIVCAAASTLLRTAAHLLEKAIPSNIVGDAATEGELHLMVQSPPVESYDYIRAVGDYLALGLIELSRDFPDQCRVRIDGKNEEGVTDGS